MENKCIRCGLDFAEKKHLKQHLKKKNICMALEMEVERIVQLEELSKKEGIKCEKCNGTYKNEESLRKHVLRYHLNKEKDKIKEDNISRKELKEIYEKQVCDLKNVIQELLKNQQSIINNDNSTNTNNTVNITLNCLMDSSGKPIEYLVNREDIAEKIIGWLKLNQKVIPAYINEKYYNKDHPENQMIRVGENKESMKLHIGGKWREYENIRGSDMILTNIGNDFGVFLEIIKADEDLYIEKKKIVKQFEKDIIKPLNWGLESSEDTSREKEFQLIQNEKGEYIRDDEDEERIKRDKLQTKVINVIHEKIC